MSETISAFSTDNTRSSIFKTLFIIGNEEVVVTKLFKPLSGKASDIRCNFCFLFDGTFSSQIRNHRRWVCGSSCDASVTPCCAPVMAKPFSVNLQAHRHHPYRAAVLPRKRHMCPTTLAVPNMLGEGPWNSYSMLETRSPKLS